MLSALKPIVYIQISPERLTVRNAKTGNSISEIPELGIERRQKVKIVGIGIEARTCQGSSVEVVNPFSHPRTLVSDFTAGQQLLRAFLRRLLPISIFALAPRVVLHPLGEPAGGLTQIEIRALHEMALGAGVSEVVVWQGRTLMDAELVAGTFPVEGRVLS